MKYKPSKNFLVSSGLLALSFFIMQGIVVPTLVRGDLAASAAAAKISAPTNTTLVGVLRKQSWEEFDSKTHRITEKNISYYLDHVDGKSVPISPKNVAESLVGQSVVYNPTTKGIVAGGNAKSSEINPRSGPSRLPQTRALVFLAQFSNSTPVVPRKGAAQQSQSQTTIVPTNPTAEQYQDILFGTTNGYVRKFYREMTHNQVNLTGNVKGWYTFDGPGSQYTDSNGNGQCELSPTNIQNMANFYQVDISNYDVIITISNCEEYNNLGAVYFGTYPELGVPLIKTVGHYDRLGINDHNGYISYPILVWNMVHELGHFFGLYHSNSLDCGEETIDTDCININQGNPFDAMGGWAGRIFNFTQQRQMGWIAEENILEITESGSYHLDNLQTQDGVVGAHITIPGIPYPIFALEHRKAEGFDSVISSGQEYSVSNGLLLYSRVKPAQITPWAANNAPYGYNTFYYWRIMDPHPTSNPMYEDIVTDAITLSTPFHDNVYGLNISISEVSDTGIDFIVSYGNEDFICTSVTNLDDLSPSVADAISPITVNSVNQTGDHYTLNISIPYYYGEINVPTNPLCLYGDKRKRLSISVSDPILPGWSSTPLYFLDVNPGEQGIHTRTIQIPSSVSGIHNPIIKISELYNLTDYEDFPLTVNVP